MAKERRPARRAAHPWIRRGAGLLAVLVVVAAVTWLARPKPTAVESARATETRLEATLDEEGRTRVRDRYVISATVAGNVRRPELHPGDAVESGSVVARILPADAAPLDARSRTQAEVRVRMAEAALGQARSVVDRSHDAWIFARDEAARVHRLAASGSATEQERTQAEFNERSRADEVTSAQFAARGAAYELDNARVLLGRTTQGDGPHDAIDLRSPVRARVLRVFQPSGGVVMAGAPLLELGDTEALEVVVDLLTADALLVTPGARAHLDAGGAVGVLQGHVRLVEPSAFTRVSALGVEEQRVNVLLDLDDPPARWRALGDGWRVEAHVVTWAGASVLTVPLGALFRRAGAWCVFTVEGGCARRREVAMGHQGGGLVEVTRGLPAGATVVVHPPDRLEDGDAVVAE